MRPKAKIRLLDMNTTGRFEIPNSKIMLDQATIDSWLDRTGDSNPIHRDKDYATRHGLKDIVVPGALIESIFIRMIEQFKTNDQMISSIEISHKKVTYVNETLTFTAEAKSTSEDGYLIETKALNENGETVAAGNIRIKN